MNDIIRRLARIPTADLCDLLGPVALDSGLRPVVPGSFAGPALTIRVPPGDNLMVHAALADVRPGDVVMVDTGGNTDRAVFGALTVQYLQKRGATGLVVDGAVRDTADLRAIGLPVRARAVTPNGPTRCRIGAISVSVQVGGRTVRPGDLVVGDGDGVVCLSAETAAAVLEQAEDRVRREDDLLRHIRETGEFPRPWLSGALAEAEEKSAAEEI